MSLIATRHSLHLLAERVISPLRVQVTGNEIALQARPDGFGTPELPQGGWVGVVGVDVVRVGEFGEERRARITSLADAAVVVGLEGGVEDAHLEVDEESAARLASAWAIGEAALAQLEGHDVEPIHLWPEHFDVATVEGAGGRARELRRLARRRRSRGAVRVRRAVDGAGATATRSGTRRRSPARRRRWRASSRCSPSSARGRRSCVAAAARAAESRRLRRPPRPGVTRNRSDRVQRGA